jgi:hypothetical protein
MKLKNWIVVGVLLVMVLAFSGVFRTTGNGTKDIGKYDEFAQCLTESGAKMFGAFWCPHCIDQKNSFGKSWDKVNYIECSLPDKSGQTPFCRSEGIKGYPTWEFADGSRQSGFIQLESLSETTGCSLPE